MQRCRYEVMGPRLERVHVERGSYELGRNQQKAHQRPAGLFKTLDLTREEACVEDRIEAVVILNVDGQGGRDEPHRKSAEKQATRHGRYAPGGRVVHLTLRSIASESRLAETGRTNYPWIDMVRFAVLRANRWPATS